MLLQLLHTDLPWSVTLGTGAAVAARRVPAPDLDPVLVQADRFDPVLLPADVASALEQRRWLRYDRARAHEIERYGLWHSVSRERSRDHGPEL